MQAYVETGAEGLEQPLRGTYPQRPVRGRLRIGAAGEEDLAAGEEDQALAGVVAHVDRAVGVQLQAGAVDQLDTAPLAGGSAVVGAQALPGQAIATDPGHGAAGHQQRQQFQRLAPLQALRATVQGAVGDPAGQRLEASLQFFVERADLLPGPLVLAVLRAPGRAGALQAIVGRLRAQADQPVDGLPDHRFVDPTARPVHGSAHSP